MSDVKFQLLTGSGRTAKTTDSPSDGYVLERQVGYVMRRAVQRHIAIFSALVPELTPTQFAALAKLCELGQASQNELGRLTAMDVATIKGVVDRLRQRGLIKSSPLASDKRRLILTPSDEGRKLYSALIARAADVTRQTLAPLNEQEQTEFLNLLEKLT